MIDVHLKIHYGGEQRYDMVRKTILVSAPYFKTVQVVNFGPDENSKVFIPLTQSISNFSISNLGKYYHACITEDLLRHHVMTVPDGDWLAFLDSDWRFPESSLKKMQEEIELCEKEDYNAIFSYQLGHSLENKFFQTEYGTRIFNYDQEMMNRIFRNIELEPNRYGWPILQKIDKKNLWCDGFLGNHCYYLFVPYKKKIVPHFFHYHFRDFDDYAYCSTMLFQSWWYVGHNVFPTEEHSYIINSEEYKNINLFKNKHKCYTSNQLREKLKNLNFSEELKSLFLTFENSQIFGCQQMYKIAKNDMKLWTTPLESECNGLCCQYNGSSIFNI